MRRVVALWVVVGTACSGRGGGPPLRPDELTKACVLYSACVGGVGINGCFGGFAQRFAPDVWRCVIAAGNDCTASLACFGATLAFVPYCQPHCDGDVTVDCMGTGVESRIDCGSPFANTGPSCFIHRDRPECGAGVCNTLGQGCRGTVAQSCLELGGVLHEVDCNTLGLTCANGVCTSPGGGGPCPTVRTPCVGTAVVQCQDGLEVLVDCPSRFVGADCVPTASSAYCGYGTACVPERNTETCSGTTVSFCAAGVPASVDCTSLGFTRCIGGRCITP